MTGLQPTVDFIRWDLDPIETSWGIVRIARLSNPYSPELLSRPRDSFAAVGSPRGEAANPRPVFFVTVWRAIPSRPAEIHAVFRRKGDFNGGQIGLPSPSVAVGAAMLQGGLFEVHSADRNPAGDCWAHGVNALAGVNPPPPVDHSHDADSDGSWLKLADPVLQLMTDRIDWAQRWLEHP